MHPRISSPVTLHLPSGTGLVILLAVLVLVLWFVRVPANRPVIVFIASIVGAAALLINTLNTISMREAQDVRSRVAESFSLIRMWNDPNFSQTKSHCFSIPRRIEHMAAEEQMRIIRENQETEQAVVEVLNFCEMIGLASHEEFVDEETLKLYFRAIVTRLWTAFSQYIERRRAEVQNPRLYVELQKVHERWSR